MENQPKFQPKMNVLYIPNTKMEKFRICDCKFVIFDPKMKIFGILYHFYAFFIFDYLNLLNISVILLITNCQQTTEFFND